jgi:copper transport protein
MKALLVVALAGFGLALILSRPGEASAHAALVRSDPVANTYLQSAPAQVALTFTEPLASGGSGIRLLDATGAPVALEAVTFTNDSYTMRVSLPKLAPGIYNVLWSNVSRIDGHGLQGSYPFTVLNADGSVPDVANQVGQIGGNADGAPRADGVAVRSLALLGLLLAAGGAALVLLWPAAPAGVRRGMTASVVVGAGVLLVSTLLQLALLEHDYRGLGLRDLVFYTRVGGFWLVRLGTALLIGMAAAFFPDAPRKAAWGVVVSLGFYVLGYAATSHAAAGSGSNWATSIDLVHGVAALLWLGAVVGVAVAARVAGKGGRYQDFMPRFSTLASVMVFLAISTGVLSALIEVDEADRLVQTAYGKILFVKLGLLVPLLGVAAYNARWGRRRLMANATGEPRRFIFTATGEVALGLAVLAAAAMLTQTTVSKSVPKPQESRAFDRTVAVDGLSIGLTIEPNRTGVNTFRVLLTEGGSAPVAADRVELVFRYQQDETVGASNLALAPAAVPGEYTGQGPYLPLEGQWRVEVNVRRPDVNDVTGLFDVRPAGTAIGGTRTGGAWSNPTPGLTWNEFGGIVALTAGLGLALSRKTLRRAASWASASARAGTVAGFGVGVLLIFGVHPHTPSGKLPTNPIVADTNSIDTGRAFYQANCAACHGRTGVPPQGLELNPYPLDLTVHVPLHPDGQLFRFVADGISGSQMPAWSQKNGGTLSEDNIWHIVNYLRTLETVDQ